MGSLCFLVGCLIAELPITFPPYEDNVKTCSFFKQRKSISFESSVILNDCHEVSEESDIFDLLFNFKYAS